MSASLTVFVNFNKYPDKKKYLSCLNSYLTHALLGSWIFHHPLVVDTRMISAPMVVTRNGNSLVTICLSFRIIPSYFATTLGLL